MTFNSITKTSRFAPVFGALALTLILTVALAAQGGPGGPGGNPTAPKLNSSYTVAPATADEIKWLTFMREEEKLARDVYTALNERWNLRVFSNIAVSEERHVNAIGTLLTRYNITDPVVEDKPGVFADPKLAALYKELMAKAALSLKDALEVGVLIEKTDIADLEVALKVTEKTDIKRVFTNLLNGSYNHLDAFETNLEVICVAP